MSRLSARAGATHLTLSKGNLPRARTRLRPRALAPTPVQRGMRVATTHIASVFVVSCTCRPVQLLPLSAPPAAVFTSTTSAASNSSPHTLTGASLRPSRRSCQPSRPRTSAAAAALAAASPPAAAVASSPLVDLFAVVLGYACLAGSLFRSVPQIAVVLRTGSAEGLSLTSNLMELLCFTVTVAYNTQQGYAFNTYGEVFACWIQDVVIVGLIFRHLRLAGGTIAAAITAFAVACAWLFSPLCPLEVLSSLQLSTVVVMAVGARLPQIWLNIVRGDAGVLSPLTCLLNVAGCLVRIFTTAVLTRDVIIMGGCVTQLILNAVLLYQSIATPGKAITATATATNAAAAAEVMTAADPPVGGAGEGRGRPAGINGGGSSTAARVEALHSSNTLSGAGGADDSGGGSGPPLHVPAVA